MKAQRELERQKQLLRERENLVLKMKEEEDNREITEVEDSRDVIKVRQLFSPRNDNQNE